MTEFDKIRFLQTLQGLPPRKSPLREPRYNEKLAQMFAKLDENGGLDLEMLDLRSISLHDLTPEGYPDIYQEAIYGWTQGVNHFIKKTPAACLKQTTFF